MVYIKVNKQIGSGDSSKTLIVAIEEPPMWIDNTRDQEAKRRTNRILEMFKIMNDYEDVDRNMFFKLKEGSRTRGHKAALVKKQCRLDMRKYSFSQRVINEWNKLPN